MTMRIARDCYIYVGRLPIVAVYSKGKMLFFLYRMEKAEINSTVCYNRAFQGKKKVDENTVLLFIKKSYISP